MNSRRSQVIFVAALVIYVVSVLQRTSLGIAGVDASERLHINAATLSSLAVIQLVVYAGLQIPVGVIVDRVGPKALLAVGALLMTAGQVALAVAPDVSIAILGRLLVGAGDATTFISVLRLLSNWFSGRRLPILSQWLGTVGQFGQILSAVPLSFALHLLGWTPAFLIAASASLLTLLTILIVVSDSPNASKDPVGATSVASAMSQLRESLGRPGTQLGFWSHFVTQSSVTMFSLLWGFPFLSVALGYGPGVASALISVIVVTAATAGPVIGLLTARHPFRRSNFVLSIVVAMGVAWAVVLAWPGQPPFWLIVVLVVVIAIGGPGSLIGFDFARTFNPMRSHGAANGIVNVGGFLATFVMMFLIGVVLDIVQRSTGSASTYSLEGFRIAFLVQFVIVGAGLVPLVHARRRTRRRLEEEEGIAVAPLWVALARAWRRKRI